MNALTLSCFHYRTKLFRSLSALSGVLLLAGACAARAAVATEFSPANSATGVCKDTTLQITFDSAPVLGNSGKIRIYKSTDTVNPVDTIDLGLNVSGTTGAL